MGNNTSCCGGLGSNVDSATELWNKTNGERNAHLASNAEKNENFIKQIIFLQKQIKKHLYKKTLTSSPHKTHYFHKPHPSLSNNPTHYLPSYSNITIENKPTTEDNTALAITTTSSIKYVENLQIGDKVYTGEILNGQRHGKGTQIWNDGAKYEGSWKNDQTSGFGVFYHIDGDVYKGYWEHDQANGEGVYIGSDGRRFEGNWVNNVKEGFGQEQWKDGSSYKGQFHNDKKEGYGVYVSANGNKYIGTWKEDKLNGKGTYYYVDGREYCGDFKDNVMQGKGKMKWMDGKEYIGEFKDGKKDGLGKYKWNDGREYVGYWLGNKQHGLGKYVKGGKETYGMWVNGTRDKWLNETDMQMLDEEYQTQYEQIQNFEQIFIS